MPVYNSKNYFKTKGLIIIIILVIVLVVVGIWYFSSQNNRNTFTQAVANQEINKNSSLTKENINELKNNNQNINSNINLPSDWKEFQGEKLEFTISLPPSWVTTSYFEQFNLPTDPAEPASYYISNRRMDDPIQEWTDNDIGITIKKFRLHNQSSDEIIQNDSQIYTLKLIKKTVIDGQNSQLYLREVKEGIGTEPHISYVMYIEDNDGLFSINATYSNQERFEELNRQTIDSVMQSFKKS